MPLPSKCPTSFVDLFPGQSPSPPLPFFLFLPGRVHSCLSQRVQLQRKPPVPRAAALASAGGANSASGGGGSRKRDKFSKAMNKPGEQRDDVELFPRNGEARVVGARGGASFVPRRAQLLLQLR